MAAAKMTVTLRLSNHKAFASLVAACRDIAEASRDRPWDTDLKRALRRLKYVAKNITIGSEQDE